MTIERINKMINSSIYSISYCGLYFKNRYLKRILKTEKKKGLFLLRRIDHLLIINKKLEDKELERWNNGN